MIARLFRRIDAALNKFGVVITEAVISMWCAMLFGCLALVSLPNAISAGRGAIVTWTAQTFLQLVLLSIIMVGQEVQAARVEVRDVEVHDTVMQSHAEIHASHEELKAAHAAHGEQLDVIRKHIEALTKVTRK